MLLECAIFAGSLFIKTGDDEFTDFSQFYRIEKYHDSLWFTGYSRDHSADLPADLVKLPVPVIINWCIEQAESKQ